MSRALLIDEDVEHARAASRVLKAAVDHLDVADGLAAVDGAAAYDLVLVNHDGLAAGECAAILDRFAEVRRQGRMLLFTSMAGREEVAALFADQGLTNILARNVDPLNEELLVTVQKILKSDIFGVAKYFSWGSHELALKVRRSRERDGVVERVREFAVSVGAQSRFADLLATTADEMITNAVYNAPTDGEGRPRYASLSRTVEVELLPAEEVTVTLCSDGRRIGISVQDPFGSVKVPTILAYLAKCLRRGSDQIDDKAGGAGLGLYYVFDAVGHFIVNIDVGARTEMIGILDLRARYRDLADKPKSFNVFVAGKP